MDTWRHGDSLICHLLTCSFVDVDGHWVIQLDIYGYLNGTYRGSGMLLHSLTVLYLNFASKLYAQTRSFNALLKDKEIIAAEVLNEYNHGVRFLALSVSLMCSRLLHYSLYTQESTPSVRMWRL